MTDFTTLLRLVSTPTLLKSLMAVSHDRMRAGSYGACLITFLSGGTVKHRTRLRPWVRSLARRQGWPPDELEKLVRRCIRAYDDGNPEDGLVLDAGSDYECNYPAVDYKLTDRDVARCLRRELARRTKQRRNTVTVAAHRNPVSFATRRLLSA